MKIRLRFLTLQLLLIIHEPNVLASIDELAVQKLSLTDWHVFSWSTLMPEFQNQTDVHQISIKVI